MKKTYLWVFGWLVAFTVLELWVASAGLRREVLITALLASTAGKAALIALYFMHLKFEGRLVWLLPVIPVCFIVLFVFGLFPDVAWHLTGNF